MTRSLVLGIKHRQQLSLSPRLLRAVRLLQLSSLDFAREVHDALGNNPFLEGDESSDGERDDAADAAAASGAQAAFAADSGPPFADSPPAEYGAGDGAANGASDDFEAFEAVDAFDGEHESWLADGLSGKARLDSRDVSPLELRAVAESLSDCLLRQLHCLPLSTRDQALAEAIVGSLDDDGYLRFPLADLPGITGLDPAPGAAEVHIALSRVQSLDPAGVGARSVQECLRLQLPAIERPEQRALAGRIIGEQFAALAAHDVPALARALARRPVDIEAALACIRRLDPHPGWRFGPAPVPYLTPDVIVRKVRGEWTATLNPAIVPKVRLNRVYAEMFQRSRCAQHAAQDAALAAHLQEARWTVSNVEQRFATILGVAQAIVSRQRHFLDYGALAMKPLGLREIAEQVGLHESTVSRVTNNKYMATPLGVFELKYFFSRAMATAGGGECSATAIRGVIKDMIAAERPQVPLSDAEIARQLARQGLVVARRTVTKYRQLLRIEAFEKRRTHA